MDRKTLTVEEAAKLLGIGRGLAYELVRRGELPALRLGRRFVIPREALEQLLAGSPHLDDTEHIDGLVGAPADGR